MFGIVKKRANSTHSLADQHKPHAIKERLEAKNSPSYLGDAVLGAVDGCVTTFAVVAGAMGGNLEPGVALLLGTANLVADGFSMAVGNYQRAQSDRQFVEKVRKSEEKHIDQIPDGEREEVRQIYSQKGFDEPLLSEIVAGITKNRELWLDTMITEEHGLTLDGQNPVRAGLVTFVAFVLAGSIPLIPLVFFTLFAEATMYKLSIIMTALAFFCVGALRGRMVHKSFIVSGFETLLLGGTAASLAYLAGLLLRGVVS